MKILRIQFQYNQYLKCTFNFHVKKLRNLHNICAFPRAYVLLLDLARPGGWGDRGDRGDRETGATLATLGTLGTLGTLPVSRVPVSQILLLSAPNHMAHAKTQV